MPFPAVEGLEPRRLLAGEAVTQLILINAVTDQRIGVLSDGAVVNVAAIGTNKLNVLAETAGGTESVRFGLDAKPRYRTENSAPYSLAGDTDGDYKAWAASLGTHTVTATPYSADNAGGTAGTAFQVTFQVVDQEVFDPVALQTSIASLAFGSVVVGTFAEATVTLTNPEPAGGSSVTIQSTEFAGAGAFSDDFNDAADVTLAPGQSVQLTVRFTPTAEGSAGGTLNVRHSGTNSPLAISLGGTGVVTNHAPVLAAIGNRTVAAGATLTIPVSATDADGDAISLSAASLPTWATFTDNGNGTGSLVLAPPDGTSGTFTGLGITATDDGSPVLSDAETFSLAVANTNVAVTRLMLYRADTDQPIMELSPGSVINFAQIGTNKLSIVAETTVATESVRFALDANANYRTENGAPYTLAGESGIDIRAWTPSLGSHVVTVTPFGADNAGGTAGAPFQVAFQVTNQVVVDPVMVQASQTTVAFGDVASGAVAEVVLTLTNPGAPGESPVTILSTEITGSAAFSDDFTDAADVTIAPGQSVQLKVRFAPMIEGPVGGTLNVRHSGANNPLPISLSGTGTVSNHAPVLAPIGDKQVLPGGTLTVPVSATDADGDAIALSASNLPAWATFTDNGNGTGSLVLSPPAGTTGTFTDFTVTATDDGSPIASDAETFQVTVSDNGVVVYGLTLINADTDQPVGSLGSVINLALIGTDNLNVRADTSAGTKSVRFSLDTNSNFRTENTAPFALAGDSGGNYTAWTPSLGSHRITAIPFSGTSGSGTAGVAFTVDFTVIEGASLVATPGSVAASVTQGGATATRTVALAANDGSDGVGYAAVSNAAWLSVGSGLGTTDDPLTLTFSTTGLALGAHQAYVTVTSPTHGGVKIPVTLTVTGSFVADQVHLSFVQHPSTTMTVVWRTMDTGTPSLVEYRALGANTWLSTSGGPRDSGTSGTLHETTLTGLAPATTYQYRVRGDDAAWSPVFTTRTVPAPGPADFDLVYFADTGLIGRTDGLDTGTAQAIQEMLRLDPDLLLPGGDYAYFNTDNRFGTLENSIDAWFNQNQPLFSRVPIMPTYGNHEVLLGEDYDAWAQRFATPQGFDGQANYSFDVGDAHFVSILAVSDTGSLSSSSLAWIENDLAAARAAGKRWIIPYFHVSPFSDGTSHPSNLNYRTQLGPIFERYGVQVALASHDQSYERTYPVSGVPDDITRTSTSLGSYDATDGVTWVKVSPAGKLSNRAGVNDFSRFQTHPAPFWTAFRDDTMHHFSRLIFSADGTLRVETYGFSGDGTPAVIIDSFEYDLGPAGGAARAADSARGSAVSLGSWITGADLSWDVGSRITVDGLGGTDGDEEELLTA